VIETGIEKQNNCVSSKSDGEAVSSDRYVRDRMLGQDYVKEKKGRTRSAEISRIWVKQKKTLTV
jgi:hypothetical protein